MKKIKRILSYVMMIMMVVFLFSGVRVKDVSASERFETSNGYLEYSITENNEIIITKHSGPDKELDIPSEIAGKPVTSIGNGAFSGSTQLTSITIPDSVTSIGNYAFRYCSSLTSITIPDSVTSIGNHAFLSCRSLTSITIPDSVTSMGNGTFSNCSSLTSIIIPDSVISIGNGAFYNCEDLTSITIPDSVTSIGCNAFKECKNLESITIPDSVTSIGDCAFSYCSSLTSITIPDSVTSIGYAPFSYCSSLISVEVDEANKNYVDEEGILFNKDKNLLITYPASKEGKSYEISSITTSIENGAFSNCSSLTSITIPDSVTSIGGSAFSNCINLTNITIPDSVTSIGDCAFYNCEYLTNITIPDSVTSIGDYAFYNCESLTNIIIPDSVTSIGNYAFGNCHKLTSIVIPNSVISIGEYTFSYCESLTSMTIPDSVTSIGDYAFLNCYNLTSIIIPNSVTNIESGTFVYCTGLRSITIPISVTYIGYDAFYRCYDFTIYGYKDSYAEAYAYENLIPFKELAVQNLNIESFTTDKQSPQISGTPVILTVKATGEGTLQYKFLIQDSKGNWATLRDYETSNTYEWKTGEVGDNTLYVDVKDGNGEVVRKEISYKVTSPLNIESFTTDKQSPQISGTPVILTVKATGEGTLQYKFLIQDSKGNWATLRNYATSNIYTWKTGPVGDKILYVDVKDGNGEVIRKSINYTVKEQLKIDSFSTDKISPQEIGSNIKLTAQASGGEGKLQYKFRVGDKNGNYLVIQKFSTNNTVTWNADYVGDMILYVDVEDESGRGVTKTINYTIKEKSVAPVVSSFTADKASPQVSGTLVTLTAKASGEGQLQYKFLIKDPQGNWYKLRDYATSNTYTWKTGPAGDKTLYVDVKDENGKVTRKSISYVVKNAN